ncbi:MAG: histidinol-phosphate transaminase [Firmicutes bacterium]|nr:histidinol-phosphate transaminase [Bacillota bacterium]
MSRFFSGKYSSLEAYTPGEQPQNRQYIKLNTNESPFGPAAAAVRRAAEEAEKMHLYCDPECEQLHRKLAEYYGVGRYQVLATNGSDEILNFAFMAFCDEKSPAVFPDITYGFYKVFAQVDHVPYRQIPLREDLTIDIRDYMNNDSTVFLANPNANTGIALSLDEIEQIAAANPDHVVVIDEAYVDFGAESAVSLIDRYENLLVTQTFSKAWSMAGARLGVGIGNQALMADLNTIKYSTNPYNINRMTQAAGIGALESIDEIRANCAAVCENRAWTMNALKELGFTMTESAANFIFVRHADMGGAELYRRLKEEGILVRHFDTERICDYIRITIGSRSQMEALVEAVRRILQ